MNLFSVLPFRATAAFSRFGTFTAAVVAFSTLTACNKGDRPPAPTFAELFQPVSGTLMTESSPAFADLDGDGRAELVLADGNGLVHAWRADGSELPGWPVHTSALPLPKQFRRTANRVIPKTRTSSNAWRPPMFIWSCSKSALKAPS